MTEELAAQRKSAMRCDVMTTVRVVRPEIFEIKSAFDAVDEEVDEQCRTEFDRKIRRATFGISPPASPVESIARMRPVRSGRRFRPYRIVVVNFVL